MAINGVKFTGITKMDLNDVDFDLDGYRLDDLQEAFRRLRVAFGENFEKVDEWIAEFGERAYISEVRNGACRCGSCDDIYEYWICKNN
jgi:hypothetical protein